MKRPLPYREDRSTVGLSTRPPRAVFAEGAQVGQDSVPSTLIYLEKLQIRLRHPGKMYLEEF